MLILTLKNGRDIQFPSFDERDTLPEATQRYIWEYGSKQSINDATAPVVKKSFDPADFGGATFEEAVDMAAAARVEDLMAGDPPGSRSRTSDPKKAEQRRLAKATENATPEVLAQVHKLLGL